MVVGRTHHSIHVQAVQTTEAHNPLTHTLQQAAELAGHATPTATATLVVLAVAVAATTTASRLGGPAQEDKGMQEVMASVARGTPRPAAAAARAPPVSVLMEVPPHITQELVVSV